MMLGAATLLVGLTTGLGLPIRDPSVVVEGQNSPHATINAIEGDLPYNSYDISGHSHSPDTATNMVVMSSANILQDPSLHKIIEDRDNAFEGGFLEMGVQVRSLFGDVYAIAPDGKLKATFDHIANENSWGSAETVSGHGSELGMTSLVRKCLGDWIQKYSVKILVDIPCGDGNWQGHIPGIDSIIYKGFDIAEKPVKLARAKNAQHPHMSFGNLDLTSQVPEDKPDILLMRDVIQHLSLEKGAALLANAKASGARYLAVSTWNKVDQGNNVEVDSYRGSASYPGFYKDDVHAAPFSLPKPVETCDNYANDVYGHDKLELIDLSTWSPQHRPDTQASSSFVRHEGR